jgi:hypothetical protein
VSDVTPLLSSNGGGSSGTGSGEAGSSSSWGVPAGWLAGKGAGGSGGTITVPGSEGSELVGWDGEEWEVGSSGDSGSSWCKTG